MSNDNGRTVFQSADKNLTVQIVGSDPAKETKGKTVITIDNDRSVGPTSTGTNVMIASAGRNIDLPGVGTLALNLYRAPQGAQELEACRVQMERAEKAKALESQIAELRAKARAAVKAV